jgi:8-oxo-dGTP diphosphatase
MLARRAEGKHLAGYWEFPGGKIEAGESPEICLERELYEELGVKADIKDFFMENIHQYESKTIRLLAYWTTIGSEGVTLVDHDEYCWLAPAELSKMRVAPADIPFIDAIQGGTHELLVGQSEPNI